MAAFTAGTEGPKHGTIGEIDNAVTVGTDQRHITGRRNQFSLGLLTLLTEFTVARGKTGDTTGTHTAQAPDRRGRHRTRRGQENGIGRFGQVIDTGITGLASEAVALWIDTPYWTRELRCALARTEISITATDEGDMPR